MSRVFEWNSNEVICTKSTNRLVDDRFTLFDGTELERYNGNTFRIKGSMEADRVRIVESLIDERVDYMRYLELRERFHDRDRLVTRLTEEEWERLNDTSI